MKVGFFRLTFVVIIDDGLIGDDKKVDCEKVVSLKGPLIFSRF